MKDRSVKDFSDPEQVRMVVLSMQEIMNDIRPTNIELIEAIAFVLGETLAYGAGEHGMSEDVIDGAINLMSQMTKASAQIHAGNMPDAISRAN